MAHPKCDNDVRIISSDESWVARAESEDDGSVRSAPDAKNCVKIENGRLMVEDGENVANIIRSSPLDSLIVDNIIFDFGSLESIVLAIVSSSSSFHIRYLKMTRFQVCDLWMAEEYLPKLIRECPTLTKIQISHCNLDNNVMLAMARAIRHNKNVVEADVLNSGADAETQRIISSAVVTNLTYLDEQQRRREFIRQRSTSNRRSKQVSSRMINDTSLGQNQTSSWKNKNQTQTDHDNGNKKEEDLTPPIGSGGPKESRRLHRELSVSMERIAPNRHIIRRQWEETSLKERKINCRYPLEIKLD